MKKKKLQSNKDPQRKKLKQSPHKSPYQLDPSDFDFLLFNFRIPPSYLSGRQLQEEINLFDAFVSNPKNAGMSLDECINAFSSEKKWIDEEDIEISECEDEKDSPEHLNHYIASAVLWGFKIQSGRKSFEDLIIKRSGPKENFSIVYSYRCLNRNCPNLGTLSQYQYDKIKISSKRCPYCRTGQLEKVKVLTNACLTWLEQYKRIQAQLPGIPIPWEQLQKYDDARTALDEILVPKWSELTTNHVPTGKEVERLRKDIKPYVEKLYKTLQVEKRICARDDCLNPLPPGSRQNKRFCSNSCQVIMKMRNARKKKKKEKKEGNQ